MQVTKPAMVTVRHIVLRLPSTFRNIFVRFLSVLTHCGQVTQICVFTLQLCKTDNENLRF